MKLRRALVLVSVTIAFLAHNVVARPSRPRPVGSPQVNVRLVTDEAEAVLAVLARKKANQPPTEADWRRLFSSEGYIRLKRREAAMQRPFGDEDFKSFVLSGKLSASAQAPTFTRTNSASPKTPRAGIGTWRITTTTSRGWSSSSSIF